MHVRHSNIQDQKVPERYSEPQDWLMFKRFLLDSKFLLLTFIFILLFWHQFWPYSQSSYPLQPIHESFRDPWNTFELRLYGYYIRDTTDANCIPLLQDLIKDLHKLYAQLHRPHPNKKYVQKTQKSLERFERAIHDIRPGWNLLTEMRRAQVKIELVRISDSLDRLQTFL
ncbi:hypothetical protein G6F56_005324 [Rhizopus delemar]|uniref:Uncharacterized protein n=1 Tax=Rhizopus stolonifer TaxID=4846 RepID=A0A367JSH3_RHIST|nr:hypothetical protein G6F56_005324 [Rhizopus delemar]RCH92887.1 hypothetical protein CU098_004524 [Rhizopus stolonifer]